MGKMVIPDPDKVASCEPQEIPGYGIVPVALASSFRSEEEWKAAIKAGVPVKIVTEKDGEG